MHYNRQRRHGNPNTRITASYGKKDTCLECDRPILARHLCSLHYKRLHTHGNTNTVRQGHPPKAPIGTVTIDGRYRVIKTERGWEWEHRVIMENKLGRKLSTDEQVHHINGDGHDNREENLVVLSHSDHVKLHKPVQYRKKA